MRDATIAGMLRLEHADRVANLVIDRVDRHNAFTDVMWAEMPRLLEQASNDESVRALVLRSSDARVFSAGADVQDLQRALDDPDGADKGLAVIQTAFDSLIEFPKPTVAVIRGACHGGGVGLAVCCDIRLADDTAVFSIPPARLGLLYPYAALRRLVWMIGPGAAKMLLFTARRFDATEAYRLGFLDELHRPEHLDAAADRLLHEIVTNGPRAVRAMKQVVGLTERASPDAEEVAMLLEREALLGSEHAEGVSAFLEKRPPDF